MAVEFEVVRSITAPLLGAAVLSCIATVTRVLLYGVVLEGWSAVTDRDEPPPPPPPPPWEACAATALGAPRASTRRVTAEERTAKRRMLISPVHHIGFTSCPQITDGET
jgi:hypothetical protein